MLPAVCAIPPHFLFSPSKMPLSGVLLHIYNSLPYTTRDKRDHTMDPSLMNLGAPEQVNKENQVGAAAPKKVNEAWALTFFEFWSGDRWTFMRVVEEVDRP